VASDQNSPKSSLVARLLGSAGPAVARVRSVNPAAAKVSAARGAAGTKELLSLSLAYIKQETKEPLNGIGRLLAFGVAGATCMGLGLVLLGLALLRGVQAAFAYVHADGGRGPFSGSLSWIPYLLASLGCAFVIAAIGFAWSSAGKRSKRNGVPQ
jgi:Putative Actinobacterial Holin-X, holin superfamily III